MYDPKKPIQCVEVLVDVCMTLKYPCSTVVERNCPVQKYLGVKKDE